MIFTLPPAGLSEIKRKTCAWFFIWIYYCYRTSDSSSESSIAYSAFLESGENRLESYVCEI